MLLVHEEFYTIRISLDMAYLSRGAGKNASQYLSGFWL